ncbi:LCP family protein [Microtetraspora malaysiensis]|uniref:LCP family protein n=1 Tax=Microtetraspora malaysiensis TaxID=161358 RepID=UPI001C3F368E|nr:LCP family protein [Microtetraspora malaysiensis]
MTLAVVIAAAGGSLYARLNADINTFAADGINSERPAANVGGQNILILGSDSRSGGNSKLGGGTGDVGRSDTALLVHVYRDGKHAVAVSIPRDTLVDIPRCRLPNGTWTAPQSGVMFNAAFTVGLTAKGNPACSQNTVEKMTGLRVDHTIVVDFAGFSKITAAVGGVRVCLPNDVYQGDLNPNRGSKGALLFPKGQQTVSGKKALDYVRIRHGIGDGSDIGRIKRQQAFISSLVKKVKAQGLNPTTLLPLAEAAASAITVDPGLGSADKLLSFALGLKDIDLHNTKFITVPWRYQGARVAIVQPDADQLWAALRADRTLDGADASGKASSTATSSPKPTRPVSGAGIRLALYNGTTVNGLGARAAAKLKSAGFTVTSVGTAASQNYTSSVVTYGPDAQDQAKVVARAVPGAKLESGSTPGITVILGSDYAQPTPTPTAFSSKARSADDDPCADLSYG